MHCRFSHAYVCAQCVTSSTTAANTATVCTDEQRRATADDGTGEHASAARTIGTTLNTGVISMRVICLRWACSSMAKSLERQRKHAYALGAVSSTRIQGIIRCSHCRRRRAVDEHGRNAKPITCSSAQSGAEAKPAFSVVISFVISSWLMGQRGPRAAQANDRRAVVAGKRTLVGAARGLGKRAVVGVTCTWRRSP